MVIVEIFKKYDGNIKQILNENFIVYKILI